MNCIINLYVESVYVPWALTNPLPRAPPSIKNVYVFLAFTEQHSPLSVDTEEYICSVQRSFNLQNTAKMATPRCLKQKALSSVFIYMLQFYAKSQRANPAIKS